MKQKKKNVVLEEYIGFLKEYKVVSIAIAFVMGTAVNDLIKSFVVNIFMPLINPLIPEETWESATVNIGAVSIGWGAFIGALLHFFILAAIIFLVVKKLMRWRVKESQ